MNNAFFARPMFPFVIVYTLSGDVLTIDMTAKLESGDELTRPLNDRDYFKKVEVIDGMLIWPNGLHLFVGEEVA